MARDLLRRHSSGPAAQISGYVDACHALDPESIRSEYRKRIAAAPTRTQDYIVEHDISGRSSGSARQEELLAHQMFLGQTKLKIPGWSPVRVVDFQTPLNSKRSDGLGEVDLLGIGEGLCVIELKVLRPNGAADTPLNALLEAVGYCAAVEANAAQILSELREADHRVEPGAISALVLAPDDYWARWERTRSKQPWRAALTHAVVILGEATGLRIGFGSFHESEVVESLDVTDPLA